MKTTFTKNGKTVTIESKILANASKTGWFYMCNGIISDYMYKTRYAAKKALQDHIEYIANI